MSIRDGQDYIDELQRELAAIKADIARHVAVAAELATELATEKALLDWLDKTGREEGHGFCHVGYGDYRYYAHKWHGKQQYPSARQTIIDAMKETRG